VPVLLLPLPLPLPRRCTSLWRASACLGPNFQLFAAAPRILVFTNWASFSRAKERAATWDQPQKFFFSRSARIQMSDRLGDAPLYYFHSLREKRGMAQTVEHGCLNNPAIVSDQRRTFTTFGIRSHGKKNRLVGRGREARRSL
jgi:hypothetical protein